MDDKEYLKILGKRIKETRLNKKISQVELANCCEFEKSNMNRIEAGRANLSILNIKKICAALNVDVHELLKF